MFKEKQVKSRLYNLDNKRSFVRLHEMKTV